MSTSFKIIERDGFTIEATQSSSLVSFDIYSEEDGDCVPETETRTIFTDNDLLEMAKNTLAVASYISEDPEKIVNRFIRVLQPDQYLSSMLNEWAEEIKDTARREAYDRLRIGRDPHKTEP